MASPKECVDELHTACKGEDERGVVTCIGKLASCCDSTDAMQAGVGLTSEECDKCSHALGEFARKPQKMHGVTLPPQLVQIAIQFGIQLLTFLQQKYPSA